MPRALFWVLAAATLGVYAAMVLWTLPMIAADAGGLAPFDMRPFGYGFQEAHAFLAALSPEGNALYRDVQQRLDLFFPALVATTLYFAIAALLPASMGVWRWVVPLAMMPVALFDWLENFAVARMLAAGADGITPDMVVTASRWTVLKSVVSTAAFTVLLVLLLWRVRIGRRGNGAA